MTVYECPIEGCDAEGTESELRGHTNAKAGHPAWSEVKDQIETSDDQAKPGDGTDDSDQDDQADKQEESPETASESPGSDTTDDDDQQEPAEEQAETNENGENDQPDDSPDSTDMPTDAELARQRDRATDQIDQETSPSPNQRDSAGSPSSTGGLPGLSIPVSTTTLAMGAGLVLLLVLLYLYTRSGEDSHEAGEDLGEQDSDQHADAWDPEQYDD